MYDQKSYIPVSAAYPTYPRNNKNYYVSNRFKSISQRKIVKCNNLIYVQRLTQAIAANKKHRQITSTYLFIYLFNSLF